MVRPNSTKEVDDSLVVHVMVAVLYAGVPEEIAEIVGAVVSAGSALVANDCWEETPSFPAASRDRTL